jgi:hypothetical protein
LSLLKCKRVISKTGEDVSYLSKLPYSELKNRDDIVLCGGMVVEADKVLDTNKAYTEFVCLMCGRGFYFQTRRYLKVLDALKVDYSGRIP